MVIESEDACQLPRRRTIIGISTINFLVDSMFTPTQDEVRKFFCSTFDKHHSHAVLTPIEAIGRDWIAQHPEYADTLSDVDVALAADYTVERGQSNPFLHLSMHLSIAEQISIDQPPGIRSSFLALARKLDSEHEAHHQIMECLGQMIWTAQRDGLSPDGAQYIDCVRRRAGQ